MDKIKIANFDCFDGHRKGMMVDDVHLHTHTYTHAEGCIFVLDATADNPPLLYP